jgi:hypothetical protein
MTPITIHYRSRKQSDFELDEAATRLTTTTEEATR